MSERRVRRLCSQAGIVSAHSGKRGRTRRRWTIGTAMVLQVMLEIRPKSRADLLTADTHTWIWLD
ncbi:hypothetical protein N801_18675 [Knoellia aerolata DSM 18566]|uniref:Uncharacterized protein n=1 Tax=Knoellia aerolata DSM 18566 TaxID=1385519 RepID=A0A0A0JW48_9MICO|nr:hypothetical protein N801_18675 [Knoellia aerolata DSM 18566]